MDFWGGGIHKLSYSLPYNTSTAEAVGVRPISWYHEIFLRFASGVCLFIHLLGVLWKDGHPLLLATLMAFSAKGKCPPQSQPHPMLHPMVPFRLFSPTAQDNSAVIPVLKVILKGSLLYNPTPTQSYLSLILCCYVKIWHEHGLVCKSISRDGF